MYYVWKAKAAHVRRPCAYSNFSVSHASVCCARTETSLPRSCTFDWSSQHRHGRRGIGFLCSATHGHALRKVRFGKGRRIKRLILVLRIPLCSCLVFILVARDSTKVRSADPENSRRPSANRFCYRRQSSNPTAGCDKDRRQQIAPYSASKRCPDAAMDLTVAASTGHSRTLACDASSPQAY